MKLLVGVPCASLINTQTAEDLQALFETTMFVTGSLVYDARETIVKSAIENNYDYVLFVDSDMTFTPKDLNNLMNSEKDICTGLYFGRKGNHCPIVYPKIYIDKDTLICHKENYLELPKEKLFKVEGCGMGFCLIKVSVLKDVIKRYGNCFYPLGNFGEDLSFCWKANQLGYEIWCNKETSVGHIGDYVYTIKDWNKNY